MKITKFLHSCVLVETEKRTALFDPGSFSWQSGLVKVDGLPAIHDIVITHEHADHYDENFVTALIEKYPDSQWITNKSIAEKLSGLGAKNITTSSTKRCEVRNIPHADVAPFGVPVEHIAVDWNKCVTHPGDTLDFDTTQEILHLPITAPWGKTVDAINKFLELKPKYVLPIHDWMLRDEWLQVVYSRLESLCDQNEIVFLRPINGQAIEVNV